MDDQAVTQAVLLFWGGVLTGLVLGGLAGWRKGFAYGVGVACLTIGATGLGGAGWLGWHRQHSLAGTEAAEAVLVQWVVERSTDASGKTSVAHAPIVRFTAHDGKAYEIKGLSRDEGNLVPGSAMNVRYRRDDPSQAVIADFQNVWGGVWALAAFGLIPAMIGIFFLATAIGDARTARGAQRSPAPVLPWRQKSATRLTVAANILFVAAFGCAILGPDSVAKAVGLTFITIGVACAIHAVAHVVRGETAWQPFAIFLVVGTAFALFGFGGYMLG